MGCDIHMAVELYKGGKWTWVKDAIACLGCDGTKVVKYGDKESPCFCTHGYHGSPGRSHGFDQRNYDAFGVLANVRNGTWGEPTPFISEPRGLPSSLSAELADEQRSDKDGAYWLGDHSFSWLALSELTAFDWSQKLHREGTVSWETFAKWDRVSPPNSYCAAASGLTVTQAVAEQMLASKGAAPYVRVTWTETLGDAAEPFYSKFIPQLKALAETNHVGPNDVRIVFGFDS